MMAVSPCMLMSCGIFFDAVEDDATQCKHTMTLPSHPASSSTQPYAPGDINIDVDIPDSSNQSPPPGQAEPPACFDIQDISPKAGENAKGQSQNPSSSSSTVAPVSVILPHAETVAATRRRIRGKQPTGLEPTDLTASERVKMQKRESLTSCQPALLPEITEALIMYDTKK